MVFRIVNPAWKSVTQKKIDEHSADVINWLNSHPNNRFVTLSELRLGLPNIAGDLNREVINGICRAANISIDNADSDDI